MGTISYLCIMFNLDTEFPHVLESEIDNLIDWCIEAELALCKNVRR